jgi:Predicted integral membrane protein
MKFAFFKKLGAVVLAYALGIIIANIGILPKASEAFLKETVAKDRPYIPKAEAAGMYAAGTLTEKDLSTNSIATIQDSVQTAFIPLALPLILFSLSVRRWLKFSGKGFLSMVLALISVSIIVATGYLIFGEKIPEGNKVAGMLIGTYTGGSINMAALAVALKVQPYTFIMTNTYDMMIGGLTILFFITAGPAVFRFFLPPFKSHSAQNNENIDFNNVEKEMAEEFDDYSGMFKKDTLLPLLGSLGLAVLIFAAGFGVSLLMPKVQPLISVILTITTLGVAASFIPKVRKIKKTFQLGMYFITAFSFVIASRCDLSVFFQVKYVNILLFVSYAYFGSLVLHLILSWIFRVDADDFLVTTTGFVYSPPFVPMVAAALKNKDVILTGLATGIIGWIIGNYMGVAFSIWLGKI